MTFRIETIILNLPIRSRLFLVAIPASAGIQVTDSVRHTVEKRYPDSGDRGMDPGCHRGDVSRRHDNRSLRLKPALSNVKGARDFNHP